MQKVLNPYTHEEEEQEFTSHSNYYKSPYREIEGCWVKGAACLSYFTYADVEDIREWVNLGYRIAPFLPKTTDPNVLKWVDWVINGEHFGEAFTTTDVEDGFYRGFEINLECYNWRVACALQALRAPWEFQVDRLVGAVGEELTMPQVALLHCLGSHVDNEDMFHVNWYKNTNHLFAFHTNLKRFLDNNPIKSPKHEKPYGEHGEFSDTSSQAWGRNNGVYEKYHRTVKTLGQAINFIKELSV